MGEREREGESRAEEDKAQAEGPPAALVKKLTLKRRPRTSLFFFTLFASTLKCQVGISVILFIFTILFRDFIQQLLRVLDSF